jgi:hypothetical protein
LYKNKLATFNFFFLLTILILCLGNINIIKSFKTFGSEIEFDENDFIIREFGIGADGNPFVTVEGIAGGTIAQGENMAYLYVFMTNNGTYGIMSDSGYTVWHSHGIKLDENNCIMSSNNKGDVEIDDAIKLTKTNASKVHKVFTAEFSMSNSDASICPTRIFDSAP